jgi:hypothetical protein
MSWYTVPRYFCPSFTTLLHGNPSNGSRNVTFGHMDGHGEGNARDSLSSRHVSSRDVTSAVGVFNVEFRRTLTLMSVCLGHVIWSGALVGSRASSSLKFLLSHTFRERDVTFVTSLSTLLTSRDLTWCSVRLTCQHASQISVVAHCQLCLRHVIWRGALVGSRASTSLKFLLSHTFRETWRACWHVSRPELHVRSRHVSRVDRSVSLRQNSTLNTPTALVTSHELTWRKDCVSPA